MAVFEVGGWLDWPPGGGGGGGGGGALACQLCTDREQKRKMRKGTFFELGIAHYLG